MFYLKDCPTEGDGVEPTYPPPSCAHKGHHGHDGGPNSCFVRLGRKTERTPHPKGKGILFLCASSPPLKRPLDPEIHFPIGPSVTGGFIFSKKLTPRRCFDHPDPSCLPISLRVHYIRSHGLTTRRFDCNCFPRSRRSVFIFGCGLNNETLPFPRSLPNIISFGTTSIFFDPQGTPPPRLPDSFRIQDLSPSPLGV